MFVVRLDDQVTLSRWWFALAFTLAFLTLRRSRLRLFPFACRCIAWLVGSPRACRSSAEALILS